MSRRFYFPGGSSLVLTGMLTLGGSAIAQSGSMSDAQIEANVLRALAGSSQLTTQSIKTTTVYGTVTLSGTATDEASRTLAETLASKAAGVKKVVDELTLSSDTGTVANAGDAAPATSGDSSQGSNMQLQSDGTYAPANDGQQSQTPAPALAAGQDQTPEPGYISPPAPQTGEPQGSQPDSRSAYGQPAAPPYRQPYQGYPRQGYGQGGYSQGGYGGSRPAPAPYGAQEAGKAVTIQPGALLRVRLNEGLNSNRVQAGVAFDGVVLNDVVADGEIAIPRGAGVQGTIVESKRGGAVAGRGELALQLTSVTLGGQQFPIASDTWTHDGPGTGGRTAGNVIGLGALGALIGAAAGGGPGAAIGAVAGGATGVGVSAAEGRGRVVIPAEAILTFHLTQPTGVTTVSQAEMDRLGYGVQQGQMQRRPPPPRYYGPRPVYYPNPY